VPYKIVFESIDITELEEKNPDYNEGDLLSENEIIKFN
jgi:hypothetical protein